MKCMMFQRSKENMRPGETGDGEIADSQLFTRFKAFFLPSVLYANVGQFLA